MSKPAASHVSPDVSATHEELVQKFKQHMIPHEGDRNDVYLDSLGKPTVGIGHLVVPSDGLKVGDRISDEEKDAFWRQDSAKALQAAQKQMLEAGITDPNFLFALADVNFQLGSEWYKEFKKTWALILEGDYDAAALEAQDSDWYEQSRNRVKAFQEALRALQPKSKSGQR
ncbi:MAG TPA: hypothetical protein VFW35_10855 [Sphingomicrobium sp.]|nr:hypothetical protein [Sphingomicrobium sp.]